MTGASLFQHWVLPFEALSVLLLAALVGAIVLSRKAEAGSEPGAKDAAPSGPATRTTDTRRDQEGAR